LPALDPRFRGNDPINQTKLSFTLLRPLMQWTDAGFVVALRRHGESGTIVELLTREHGRHLGLVRGGQSPKLRAVLQPGNEVAAIWRGRLAEHLGTVGCELVRAHAARFIDDPDRLAGLAAATALIAATLPEREPHADIFASFAALLAALDSARDWPAYYVGWECSLLAALGFGLELARCAVTGTATDLAYVSPRSGRAVSREAGRPYHDKLLPLPDFLWRDAPSDQVQIALGLQLTEHFLLHHVLLPQGRTLPAARSRLTARLRQAPRADTFDSRAQSVIPAQAGIQGNGSGGDAGPPPTRRRRL
jgi:DNA repair protein RecO (recombination protein O)